MCFFSIMYVCPWCLHLLYTVKFSLYTPLNVGDSTLDTSTERAEEKSKKSKEKKEEPVFRDATKQLLIRSLPPVLTLHMKRFLQDGRRLRKNGCHIDFPNLLDMAPFCDHNCKV